MAAAWVAHLDDVAGHGEVTPIEPFAFVDVEFPGAVAGFVGLWIMYVTITVAVKLVRL